MLIAGLSTRISYAMISTYQSVVSTITAIGYPRLARLSDAELSAVVAPLGLQSARVKFCRSLMMFIDGLRRRNVSVETASNDELINLIQREVHGAGYKVAQCCVLYAKGYHCGAIPVDSGMRDKLSLCLGFRVARTPFGHEQMRKQLEALVSQIDCRAIAEHTGYGHLDFPMDRPLTWWVHLVLIYYKRRYCNRPLPQQCPLRSEPGSEIRGPCTLHRDRHREETVRRKAEFIEPIPRFTQLWVHSLP